MSIPLRVLLLEDNPSDAELTLHELRKAGFEPDWKRVETKEEFLASLDPSLDLILADYGLPQFDGLQALDLLKARGLDIPFILLSGTIGEDIAVEAIQRGAADYLIKDRMVRLGIAVKRSLEEKRLRDEKRKTEIDLYESERFVRSILDTLDSHIAVLDESGTIIAVNGAWNEFALENGGNLKATSVGANYLAVCDAAQGAGSEFADQMAAGIRSVIRNAQKNFSYKYEYPCHSPLEQRWFLIYVNRFEGSGPVKVVVAHTNVTSSKLAAENIRLQLNRLSALRTIEEAIAGTMDLDMVLKVILEECISQINADAANILLFDPTSQTLNFAAGRGFRTDALRHTHLALGEGYAGRVALARKMTHISNLQVKTTDFLRSPSFSLEGFVSYYCVPLIAKDEIKGVMEVFHRVAFEGNNEWINFLNTLAGQAAIAIDNATLFKNLQLSNIELEKRVDERTAELNHLNMELEHANRAKDEFLANMSHELRTPLNSVMGFSDSLLEQRRGPLNEKQEQYIKLIRAGGEHLLSLITDILEVSKIGAGKFEIHPDTVSVNEVCESSLIFIRETAAKKSISIEYKNEQSISSLYADPKRIKQILINLLNNAVKFTPEKGKVTLAVETSSEKDEIHFSVIDTGIGIAHDDLSRLFTPFTQLDSSMSRQHEGTGLGLVLVYKLTELHGGSVRVSSEPGLGSQFTVSLPWSEQDTNSQKEGSKPPHSVEAVDASPSDNRGLILLAEDNETNIFTIQEYLEAYGYELIVARNGVEAIAMAKESSPALILMDMQMPEMDGLEATRRLRADPRFATLPIIALTALAMPGDRERCLAAGANEYLSKPIKLKELEQEIRQLLKTSS